MTQTSVMSKKKSFWQLPGRPWTVSLVIFCLAFTARIIFYYVLKQYDPGFGFKTIGINGWLEIARHLIAGEGYSEKILMNYFPIDHLVPTASRGPVPVFVLSALLLVFRDNYVLLFLYSWLLSAVTAVCLYFLSAKVLGSKKLALTVACIYSLYLPEMYISTMYASAAESLFTLLLMGYFAAMIRSVETLKLRYAFGAAVLLGLACLARPVVLFFPVLYAVWMLARNRAKAIPSVILFVMAFSLCLAPWVMRNQRVFGRPIVTTTLVGYNLLRHNAMIAENKYSLYLEDDFEPIAREIAAANGYDFNHVSEAQLDEIFKREAVRIIRNYPWRYLKLCAIRLIWLWYKVNGELPLCLGQNIVIYLFMFPGLVLALMRRHSLTVFAVGMIYFILMHTAINAQFRFICPLMPYGIMMAVYAAFLLFQWLRERTTLARRGTNG